MIVLDCGVGDPLISLLSHTITKRRPSHPTFVILIAVLLMLYLLVCGIIENPP